MKPIVANLKQRILNGEIKRRFPHWYFPQRKEAKQNLLEAHIAKEESKKKNTPLFYAGLEWGYNNNFKTGELPVELFKEMLYFSFEDSLCTFAKSHTNPITWENNRYTEALVWSNTLPNEALKTSNYKPLQNN